MEAPEPGATVKVDPDGVRVIHIPRRPRALTVQRSFVVLLVVVLLVGGTFVYFAGTLDREEAHPAILAGEREKIDPPHGAELEAKGRTRRLSVQLRARPKSAEAVEATLPPDSVAGARGSNPPADEGLLQPGQAEGDEGEPSGIALFPPPGTNPPKEGLIVPDDFELPPGYVRHYQVTDDGKPLPPILMFHPDAEITDEQGNPVAVPPDLVVPPELAPPGFPLEKLQVPEPEIPYIEVAPGADARPQ